MSRASGVVMPGFVDTHTHVGAHIFGTVCDDENIITALYDLWFPMEAAYNPEITHAASCLAGSLGCAAGRSDDGHE
jgi:cytosine/adenosine deaminase-related metal-dependent hydrolase